MVNKPKQIGTKFESAVVKEFKAAGFEARRLALSGAEDKGDVEISIGENSAIVIECKAYKSYTRKDVKSWRIQTLKEADNYRKAYKKSVVPLLAVSQYNKSMNDTYVHYYKLGIWYQFYLDEFICLLREEWSNAS